LGSLPLYVEGTEYGTRVFVMDEGGWGWGVCRGALARS